MRVLRHILTWDKQLFKYSWKGNAWWACRHTKSSDHLHSSFTLVLISKHSAAHIVPLLSPLIKFIRETEITNNIWIDRERWKLTLQSHWHSSAEGCFFFFFWGEAIMCQQKWFNLQLYSKWSSQILVDIQCGWFTSPASRRQFAVVSFFCNRIAHKTHVQ